VAERPLWRWALFCVGLDLWFRFGWEWARRLFGWCVLRSWVAVADDDPILIEEGEAPF
jgi:hypothetical protein